MRRKDIKETREGDFSSPEGPVTVRFMHQRGWFGYAERDGVQILEISYKSGDLSMIVVLPKKGHDLMTAEDSLNADSFEGDYYPHEVILTLPRFKCTQRFQAGGPLIEMGMARAFSDDADFSGMWIAPPGLKISKVIHKAFIDVNEEGTEAAAASAVLFGSRGSRPKPNEFMADHPFILAIRENRSRNILFMGRVENPTS